MNTSLIRKLYIILIYFFCAVGSKAQLHYFTHYQVEQGLSNNAVLCSLQDRMGFMWFGTKDGLNRFDGYSFRVFQNDPTSPSTLGSNYIRVLHEADDGKIWVGTDQGIYIFDPTTEKFTLLHPKIIDEILDIQQDKSGNIWFISDLVLYQYIVVQDSIIQRSHRIDVSALRITKEQNEIWVGTTVGEILKYQPTDQDFVEYVVYKDAIPTVNHRIEKLYYVSGSHQMIIGTRKQGIKLLDIRRNSYRELLARDHKRESIFVRDIILNKGSEYWFATESGVISYDIVTDEHYFITRQKDDPWSLADNAVYTFCKDQEGAIWIGTYFGGINYYSWTNTFFEKFFPKTTQNSISGFAVREIAEDKYGHIWIGTEDGGLNKFDPQTHTFTNFNPGVDRQSIAHSNIHGLLVTGDTLWVGTFEHGLDLLNVQTGKVFRHYNADNQNINRSLGNNFIFNILKTKRGDIFLATGRGLYQYSIETRTFQRTPHTHAPRHIFYTTLFEDDAGTIWLGTWRDGLFYFNPSTQEKGRFTHDFSNPRSLSSNRVNRIFQDSRRDLWVATEGGLCKLNKETMDFTRFDKQTGLPSNLILSLLEDDDGLLWISTSKGLVRFDPVSHNINVFTRSNGLLSDQFNYNSSYKDKLGNLYFGSVKGLIRFQPRDYIEVSFQAPVYITGFQVHNQELEIGGNDSPLQSSIIFTEKVVLKHNQSTFSIDFAALSFSAPSMTEYAYRMEGLDKDWTRLKTNRKVYFTNIAPGKYRFRVNLVDSKGQFKGKETYIDIEITPPFWASTAAYLLYFFITLLTIYLLVRNYDRRIKDRNRERLNNIKHEREKALYQAKIDFFTLIVHEIRTPLTLIKAPLEKVIQLVDASPTVKRNLDLIEQSTGRLITLSGQLLDFRKVEVNGFKLTFKTLPLSVLLLETFHGFLLSAERRRIKMTIETPEEAVWADMDKEAFIKIVTNLIDNAIKYCSSFVHVQLERDLYDTRAAIRIKFVSDGPLIPAEMQEKVFEPFYRMKEEIHKQGTGLGLALARSLAELLNGSLELEQGDGGLNVFVLTLPQTQSDHGNQKS